MEGEEEKEDGKRKRVRTGQREKVGETEKEDKQEDAGGTDRGR